MDEERDVATPLLDLLVASKRLPEVLVYLKVGEAAFLKRVFDERRVREDWNQEIEKLRAAKREAREAARQKILAEEVEEGGAPPAIPEELNPADDEQEEEDWPKIEDRIAETKAKLIEQRTQDQEKLDALRDQIQETAGVQVLYIIFSSLF